MNLVYAFVAGYSAYYLCRANPLGGGRRPGAIVLVLTVAAAVSGILWLLIGHAWNSLTMLVGAQWGGILISRHLSALIVGLGEQAGQQQGAAAQYR